MTQMDDRPFPPDVLADRRVFVLRPDALTRVLDALDRPAKDVPGLADLLRTPTVLDRT